MRKTRQSYRIVSFELQGRYMLCRFDADWCGQLVPGQFFMVHVAEDGERLLGRPFCVSDCSEGWVEFVAAVVGGGTRQMARTFHEGMDIDVVGPLGNGFTVSRSYEDILLVGGGVGAAELVLLAKQLNAQGRPARFICGAGTKQDLVHLDRIREHCREVVVTTEDGSDGETGIVTGPLERMLGEGGVDIVAACGPDGMLKAVAEMALENETESLVATEERMACGIGACFGCTVPLMVNGRLKMARACKDGPVFRGKAFIEGAKHEASRES